MKVVTLAQFGEDRFMQELQQFSRCNYPGDTRNKNWFSRIPEIYKTRFEEWFFLTDNDQLLAFSTIQKFDIKCYRLLTRTYYHPEYRRKHLCYERNKKTPAMYMLDAQLEYIKDYKTLFISMQDLSRRNALKRFMNKLGSNWQMLPTMAQTCNEVKDNNCWQNIIFTGEVPQLPSISIDEWKTL